MIHLTLTSLVRFLRGKQEPNKSGRANHRLAFLIPAEWEFASVDLAPPHLSAAVARLRCRVNEGVVDQLLI
jgi:hypothetical protein